MRVEAQDAQNHGFGFRFRVWNAEQWIRIKGLAGQNAGLRVQGVGSEMWFRERFWLSRTRLKDFCFECGTGFQCSGIG